MRLFFLVAIIGVLFYSSDAKADVRPVVHASVCKTEKIARDYVASTATAMKVVRAELRNPSPYSHFRRLLEQTKLQKKFGRTCGDLANSDWAAFLQQILHGPKLARHRVLEQTLPGDEQFATEVFQVYSFQKGKRQFAIALWIRACDTCVSA